MSSREAAQAASLDDVHGPVILPLLQMVETESYRLMSPKATGQQ